MATKKAAAKKSAGKKATLPPSVAPAPARVSQQDVPSYSLDKALTVPESIIREYGNGPATPVEVAAALNQSLNSSSFKMLTGAAIAYGLTTGGYNAASVALTDLSKRILMSREDGDDVLAKRQAFLKPTVIKRFLEKYEGHALPRDEIGKNVLADFGVPRDRTDAVQKLIVEGAKSVGLLKQVKDTFYVQLTSINRNQAPAVKTDEIETEELPHSQAEQPKGSIHEAKLPEHSTSQPDPRMRRVFVTHGKNKAFVEPIKQLLEFGEMLAVVSVEKESVSQPVPDKVMNDMRSCGAAIIHVEDELRLLDSEAKEHVVLNENVLMEIGAAFALYGRRFVLLVKDGVKLPSNTQGLYEVRYQGDNLSGEATIKLLKAIQDIKNHPLPSNTK